MDSDALLAGLNAGQVEAVTTDGAPVVVLAGAGSGKTRVLTRRIAWRIAEGHTDPNRVLALTFTRKAASELRHRLAALELRDPVTAGTFHGLALIQLRQRWAERGVTPPGLLDRKVGFVSRLLGSLGGGSGGGGGRGGGRRRGRVDAVEVVSEIEWARARLVGPDTYPPAAAEAGRTPPLPPEQFGQLLERYQQEKQRRRMVDFDDLLMLAIRDLREDAAYADAVRWRHRHFYVDEFQDVNPLQYELLMQWQGDRTDLFVVGDPNQAIYGWNGADPELLNTFSRRHREATIVELVDNYRSSPQVLALAATLTRKAPLRANRSDGPTPTITGHPTDTAEAAAVAAAVREAHSVAGSWSDQAVLVRTNAQLVLLEQAMAEAGIPTRLRGGSGPLATPEVRTELKLLSAPDIDLPAALTDLEARLAEEPEPASVARIERRANLQAFIRLVNDYIMSDGHPTGPGLAAWVGTLESGDVPANTDAVELATFHGSKGLEWPVVHLAGIENGLVPIAYATTGGQLAEEQRLLYVAITRAEQELHLSWAAERTFGNNTVGRQPSPFLSELAATIGRLGVGPAQRVDWRAELEKSRQTLAEHGGDRSGGSAPPADPIYEALRQWRARKARAADVPPHVVFADRTLRAIADTRPSNRAQLGAVPGMRPAKLHRYGDDLLQLLSEKTGHGVVAPR